MEHELLSTVLLPICNWIVIFFKCFYQRSLKFLKEKAVWIKFPVPKLIFVYGIIVLMPIPVLMRHFYFPFVPVKPGARACGNGYTLPLSRHYGQPAGKGHDTSSLYRNSRPHILKYRPTGSGISQTGLHCGNNFLEGFDTGIFFII